MLIVTDFIVLYIFVLRELVNVLHNSRGFNAISTIDNQTSKIFKL